MIEEDLKKKKKKKKKKKEKKRKDLAIIRAKTGMPEFHSRRNLCTINILCVV